MGIRLSGLSGMQLVLRHVDLEPRLRAGHCKADMAMCISEQSPVLDDNLIQNSYFYCCVASAAATAAVNHPIIISRSSWPTLIRTKPFSTPHSAAQSSSR